MDPKDTNLSSGTNTKFTVNFGAEHNDNKRAWDSFKKTLIPKV